MSSAARQHAPNLPDSATLTSKDVLCTALHPWREQQARVDRVFHEAEPMAYTGNCVAPLRCKNCAMTFPNAPEPANVA